MTTYFNALSLIHDFPNDPEIVMAAVTVDGRALTFASETL